MYRVICRELSLLFDPPVIEQRSMNLLTNNNNNNNTTTTVTTANTGDGFKLPSHPASLTPLAALQDSCLKTLSIVRVLCRSEGQAIIIKDQDISSSTYHILYTGSGLSWSNIEAGTLGTITLNTNPDNSFVMTVLRTHKSMIIPNCTESKIYNPSIDGRCNIGSSLLLTPLKGRGNSVIGVIISSKTGNSLFTQEDEICIEFIALFSSLTLYWGDGLSSIYQKLSKTVNKIEELETSVKLLKQNTKR